MNVPHVPQPCFIAHNITCKKSFREKSENYIEDAFVKNKKGNWDGRERERRVKREKEKRKPDKNREVQIKNKIKQERKK